jgi:hypothetical protein
MRAWTGTLKTVLLRILSAVTGRHAVLLAAEAADETLIFRLQAPYRLPSPMLTVQLLEAGPGWLTATLVGYDGHFPA